MKKLILTVLTIATLSTSGNAQVFEEGNVSVDLYYGFPNLYKVAFKTLYAEGNVDAQISGIGPLGLRAEYMIADKFGLGVDVGYNNLKLSIDQERTYYNDQTNMDETRTYTDTYGTSKLGVMLTFNYHALDNDNMDLALIFGAGYGKRTFTYSSTDPNQINESFPGLIPVALKIGAVYRYFFTDNIGFNIGVGFGQGGLLNAGLSLKF